MPACRNGERPFLPAPRGASPAYPEGYELSERAHAERASELVREIERERARERGRECESEMVREKETDGQR